MRPPATHKKVLVPTLWLKRNVRNLFHLYEKAPISIKALMENLDYYDSEMEACTDAYAECVSEQFEEAKKLCSDPILLVEQHLDFSNYVPQGFGTGDCVIVADKMLKSLISNMGRRLFRQSEIRK